MPPIERCPLRPQKPASVDCSLNSVSSRGCLKRNATFIVERAALCAWQSITSFNASSVA
ncbi:Uncharacterised protein [Burkholderia pseudomallei]|nr:Uncharacterised protein [Burkholderia pseudomallei]